MIRKKISRICTELPTCPVSKTTKSCLCGYCRKNKIDLLVGKSAQDKQSSVIDTPQHKTDTPQHKTDTPQHKTDTPQHKTDSSTKDNRPSALRKELVKSYSHTSSSQKRKYPRYK